MKKERGQQGGAVLPLTCAGDVPWRSESVREEVAAGTGHAQSMADRPTAAAAATETKS